MAIIDRFLSSLVILLSTACSAASSTSDAPSSGQVAAADAASAVPGFRPLRLGGGGFVVDLDFSPDGRTRIVRTDVHGAYVWDEPRKTWKQLITASSMPAGDSFVGKGTAVSVYAIRVAPSDSSRLYMAAPAFTGVPSTVYRSYDRGAHWVRTKFKPVEMSVQSEGRLMGPKMTVDPRNPDIVLLGDTAGRLYRTADGGESWTVIDETQVPAGPEPTVAFAPRNEISNSSATQVYAATGSNGVYRSTDGGLHWARTQGGPQSVDRMVAAPDGLYVTDRDGGAKENAWKLVGDQWTRLPIAGAGGGNGWHSIAVDPRNSKHVVLGLMAGNLTSTFDGGRTWSRFYPDAPDRIAADIPWLAWTNERWMSNGNMLFDPTLPNRLYMASGIGVWLTLPSNDDAKPKWHSQTNGIEELIVNDLIVPFGGKPIIAVQDRGVFRIESPELYPFTHGPDRDVPIRHAWSVDYAAGEPSFVAYIANGGATDRSGFSNDGGRSWSAFASNSPSLAPGNLGGTIAVSTRSNIVWAPANNGRPFFTLDGGKSWRLAQFPADLPTSGELGWSFSFYQNRHVFAADRVQPNTFYAYNYGPSSAPSAAGTYRSGDGGATWSKVSAGFGVPGGMGTSARLASVPGQAGHLFFVIGTTGLQAPHPYDAPMKRSHDGGRSWHDVKQTQEIWAIGFGKAAKGKTYPAIYIAGYANGDREPAIYRSIDDAETWQKLTSYPAGNIDAIRAISGDMNIYGRIYYGYSGSGAGYAVAP